MSWGELKVLLPILRCFFLMVMAKAIWGMEPYNYYPYQDFTLHTPVSIQLNSEEIEEWIAFGEKTFSVPEEQLRFFTYLFTAFRDFVFLSEYTTHHYFGTFTALGHKISDLLLRRHSHEAIANDVFSVEVTQKIFPHFVQRFSLEEKLRGLFPKIPFYLMTNRIQQIRAMVLPWIPWAVPYQELPLEEAWFSFSLKDFLKACIRPDMKETVVLLSLFCMLAYNEMIVLLDHLPHDSSLSNPYKISAFLEERMNIVYAKAFSQVHSIEGTVIHKDHA